jgi:glucose-6-phosphate 1-dehydrogenase
VWILLLLSLVSLSAHAGIYQCTAADGHAVFQDRPCFGQNSKRLEIETPSEAQLQKLRIEERQRDIQYLELKMRERELALREQQAAIQAARVQAYNRAIVDSQIDPQEAYVNEHKSRAAWRRYKSCLARRSLHSNLRQPCR